MEREVYRYLRYLVKTQPRYFFSVTYEPKPPFSFKPNRWGIRYYLPDFKLFTRRGVYYLETKGFMDLPDQVKLKLVKRDYPYIKLRVIRAREYSIIRKRMRELGV